MRHSGNVELFLHHGGHHGGGTAVAAAAAEYVTLTKSGASGASSATTARAAPNVRSPFGGNISNESGQAHAENMSDTVTMTPL